MAHVLRPRSAAPATRLNRLLAPDGAGAAEPPAAASHHVLVMLRHAYGSSRSNRAPCQTVMISTRCGSRR